MPRPKPWRGGASGREGYALLASVVVLVLISVVGAMAIAPNAAQVNDQWRTERTLDRLTRLTDGTTAIFRFKEDVTVYPGALSHLSKTIANTELSLCGTTYGGSAGGWNGRYAGRIYPATGTPVPIGTMQDTLEYDNTGGTQALVVVIRSVREEQARQLDLKTDGAFDGTAGRVRYTAADAEGLVTLRWRMTITSC